MPLHWPPLPGTYLRTGVWLSAAAYLSHAVQRLAAQLARAEQAVVSESVQLVQATWDHAHEEEV